MNILWGFSERQFDIDGIAAVMQVTAGDLVKGIRKFCHHDDDGNYRVLPGDLNVLRERIRKESSEITGFAIRGN